MKILAVTEDDFLSLRSLFRKHEVDILPKNHQDVSTDLIVFMGGTDVCPERYGGFPSGNYYDRERDSYEAAVFSNLMRGRISYKKILGICRGMQILNVFLGGNLVSDIQEFYGRSHEAYHPLNYRTHFFLDFLENVNSIHHQCVHYIGENMSYQIVATEPSTSSPEIVLWGNRILGLQFHPEYFRSQDLKDRIADRFQEWVDEEKYTPAPKKSSFRFNVGNSEG